MCKICGFYASNIHLITMILPFVKEKIQEEVKIETFFEENLKESINLVLNNLITNKKIKQDILKINWKNTELKKHINIENNLKELSKKKNSNIIFIGGTINYINDANNVLNKYIKQNDYKKTTIINCYNILEFRDNIKEILDEHDYILNTSGIHKTEEIFEEYKKAN